MEPVGKTSWAMNERQRIVIGSQHAVHQSGVRWRLTASTGLRIDRRHIPRSCEYDVGCCRSKKHGVYICQFFSYIFSRDIIEEDCEHSCRAPFRDFHLRATLANGDV